MHYFKGDCMCVRKDIKTLGCSTTNAHLTERVCVDGDMLTIKDVISDIGVNSRSVSYNITAKGTFVTFYLIVENEEKTKILVDEVIWIKFLDLPVIISEKDKKTYTCDRIGKIPTKTKENK